MSDKDIIQAAYEEALKGLFNVYVDSVITGTVISTSTPLERFRDGYHALCECRDELIDIVKE